MCVCVGVRANVLFIYMTIGWLVDAAAYAFKIRLYLFIYLFIMLQQIEARLKLIKSSLYRYNVSFNERLCSGVLAS